jgi:hypothetical protein
LFDGPDPNSSTSARNVTTVPTQALFFLNNPLVHRQSERFAGRLLVDEDDERRRVDLAYRRALGRPATDTERDRAIAYLADCRAELARDGVPAQIALQAWASLARTVFASNEFLFVD